MARDYETTVKAANGKRRKVAYTSLDWGELSSYYDSFPGNGRAPWDTLVRSSDKWLGGSEDDLTRYLKFGDPKPVAAARKTFQDVDASIDLSTFLPQNRYDPIGGVPCVPRVLSGNPCNMRRRVRRIAPLGKVRVFVCIDSSAGLSAETVEKRGAACIALVSALSKIRPVELYAYSGTAPGGANLDSCVLIRISSSPFDLSAIGAALGRVAIARRFTYRIGVRRTSELSGKEPSTLIGWAQCKPRDLVGAAPGDIVIPGQHCNFQHDMTRNPIGWVRAMIYHSLRKEGIGDDTFYRANYLGNDDVKAIESRISTQERRDS